jgi:hypothetical protein
LNYNFESSQKGSTRHKLEEATYFYQQMKLTLEDDKIYSFNLSAFVTAARSVTLIMKVEFAHVTGFDSWYKDKLKSMQSDDFEFFNQMRRATVHINRVKPNKKVSIGIFESIRLAGSVNSAVNKNKSDKEYSSQETGQTVIPNEPPEKNIPTSSKMVERFFKE